MPRNQGNAPIIEYPQLKCEFLLVEPLYRPGNRNGNYISFNSVKLDWAKKWMKRGWNCEFKSISHRPSYPIVGGYQIE